MLLWESLLLNHIIPSIFDAAASLLLVLLIFKIFRVKNPATRFMFLFLPLLKAFIVFIDSSASTSHARNNMRVSFSIRMPDPLGLITSPTKEISTVTYDHSALLLALGLTIVIISGVLVARWIQLFLFFNRFRKAEPVDESEYPRLYERLRYLSAKFNIKVPVIVVSNNYHYVPFSIGYKRPIIVVSKELINSFSQEQLDIMLAHELAHIKRKDSFTGWIALILRDCMFFNPLVRFSYRALEEEKEKTCDIIALEKTSTPPLIIANTLVDIALFHHNHQSSQRSLVPMSVESFYNSKTTLERRIASIKTPVLHKKSSKLRTSLRILIFLMLLYIQPGFTIKFSGFTIFLR